MKTRTAQRIKAIIRRIIWRPSRGRTFPHTPRLKFWKDHGKIGLDAWGHYFEDSNGKEYVVVFEDFPGNVFLDDKLTHEIVKIGDDSSVKLDVSGSKYIPNVTGYFTLFREK